MVKKFLKILNIGRFHNYSASGDVELKRVNVVYGENGFGKTTLAAILRSLNANDPSHIIERATLGNTNSPEAQLLLEHDRADFTNGAWSKHHPHIEIFDSAFINHNVFSGEQIAHTHKKNLYRFAVGEQGVQLAKQVDELDEAIRTINEQTATKSREVQVHTRHGCGVDAFLALQREQDIAKKILEQKEQLQALEKSSEILRKQNLEKISELTLDVDDIAGVLSKTVAGVSADAERSTKEHIKTHMPDGKGEGWIQLGLRYLQGSACPFCGQNCANADIIKAYQGYFNDSYAQLKNLILTKVAQVESIFSDRLWMVLQTTYSNNGAVFAFWTNYIQIAEPQIVIDELETLWAEIKSDLLDSLRKKLQAPLELVDGGILISNAKAAVEKINSTIKIYNEQVDGVNREILAKKQTVGGTDLNVARAELQRMEILDARFQSSASKCCDEYQQLAEQKKQLEKEKKQAKKDLEAFDAQVFNQYAQSINKHLIDFGAGFKISKMETSYSGGKPSSSYFIEINSTIVDLSPTDDQGKPSFRNTLSNGDRNALAFAFFLARLEQDAKLGEKIVVFDDPITSLDIHRKTKTKQEILSISSRAKQTIVLSHDKQFLRKLWDDLPPADVKTLALERQGQGSVISAWDIAIATQGDYFQDYATLVDYVENGLRGKDLIAVARCIRPVLEGYLRIKCPQDFSHREWLGDFIKKIRNAAAAERLANLQSDLGVLDSINDYSKDFHHKSPEEIIEPTDTELTTYATKTLGYITTR